MPHGGEVLSRRIEIAGPINRIASVVLITPPSVSGAAAEAVKLEQLFPPTLSE